MIYVDLNPPLYTTVCFAVLLKWLCLILTFGGDLDCTTSSQGCATVYKSRISAQCATPEFPLSLSLSLSLPPRVCVFLSFLLFMSFCARISLSLSPSLSLPLCVCVYVCTNVCVRVCMCVCTAASCVSSHSPTFLIYRHRTRTIIFS